MGAADGSSIRLIRWAHPLGFATYLRHLGAPVDSHFRRHKLPSLCDNPGAFVPLLAAWSFWDQIAQKDDPLLGWHVGRFHGDRKLGEGLLQQLVGAPTLYQALYQFAALIGAEASHLCLGIHERRDCVLFYTHYPDLKGAPGYHVSQAYQIEVYLAFLRHFLGPQWLPDEIGVELPCASAELYEHLPGTRIVTGARLGYIAVPRSQLHRTAASAACDQAATGALQLVHRLSHAQTLKLLLTAYLGDGYPSAQFAAELMDMSVRTLYRRLAVEGFSYARILDDVRFQRAKQLLGDAGTSIADVSVAVGFDDPTHFSRMFRRIGGLSPRQYRKSLQY